jgi:hypothetical protein
MALDNAGQYYAGLPTAGAVRNRRVMDPTAPRAPTRHPRGKFFRLEVERSADICGERRHF